MRRGKIRVAGNLMKTGVFSMLSATRVLWQKTGCYLAEMVKNYFPRNLQHIPGIF